MRKAEPKVVNLTLENIIEKSEQIETSRIEFPIGANMAEVMSFTNGNNERKFFVLDKIALVGAQIVSNLEADFGSLTEVANIELHGPAVMMNNGKPVVHAETGEYILDATVPEDQARLSLTAAFTIRSGRQRVGNEMQLDLIPKLGFVRIPGTPITDAQGRVTGTRDREEPETANKARKLAGDLLKFGYNQSKEIKNFVDNVIPRRAGTTVQGADLRTASGVAPVSEAQVAAAIDNLGKDEDAE